MSKKKSKKSGTGTLTAIKVFQSIRKTWGSLNPVTRKKGDDKKASDKKACRGKKYWGNE